MGSGCGLSLADDPHPARFFEYLVLARVALARGEGRMALPLLRRLLEQSEQGRHITRMIDALKLLALARHQAGDASGAYQALIRALRLAKPGGLARTFADEGEAMIRLLAECGASIAPQAQQGDADARRLLGYIDHLTEVFAKRRDPPLLQLHRSLNRSLRANFKCCACSPPGAPIRRSPQAWSLPSAPCDHTSNASTPKSTHATASAAARARDLGIIP